LDLILEVFSHLNDSMKYTDILVYRHTDVGICSFTSRYVLAAWSERCLAHRSLTAD